MSKPRYHDWSPEFREEDGADNDSVVSVERTHKGVPRFRLQSAGTVMLLTEARAYTLADALDRAIEWLENQESEEGP